MIPAHIFNPHKHDLGENLVFHVFFPDVTTMVVYDAKMDDPIIRGRPAKVYAMITDQKNRHNPFLPLKDREMTFYIYKISGVGYFDSRTWPKSKLQTLEKLVLPVSGA